MATDNQLVGRNPFQQGFRNPFSQEALSVSQSALDQISPANVFLDQPSGPSAETMFGKPEAELTPDERGLYDVGRRVNDTLFALLGTAGAGSGTKNLSQYADDISKKVGGSTDDWMELLKDPGMASQKAKSAAQRLYKKVIPAGDSSVSTGTTSRAARSTSGQMPVAGQPGRAAGAEALPSTAVSGRQVVPFSGKMTRLPSSQGQASLRSQVQQNLGRGARADADALGRAGRPAAAGPAASATDEATQSAQAARNAFSKKGKGLLGLGLLTGGAAGVGTLFGENDITGPLPEDEASDSAIYNAFSNIRRGISDSPLGNIPEGFDIMGNAVSDAYRGLLGYDPASGGQQETTDPRVVLQRVLNQGGQEAEGGGGPQAPDVPDAQDAMQNRRDQQQSQLEGLLDEIPTPSGDLSAADEMPSPEEVKRRRQAILDAMEMARPEDPDLSDLLTGAAQGALGRQSIAQTLLGAAAGTGKVQSEAEEQQRQHELSTIEMENALDQANLDYQQQLASMGAEDAARKLQSDMQHFKTRLNALNAQREQQMGPMDYLEAQKKAMETAKTRAEMQQTLQEMRDKSPRSSGGLGILRMIRNNRIGQDVKRKAMIDTLSGFSGMKQESLKGMPTGDLASTFREKVDNPDEKLTGSIQNILETDRQSAAQVVQELRNLQLLGQQAEQRNQ